VVVKKVERKNSFMTKDKKKGNGKGKKLTLKQAKFTKEYLKSGNATDAARKVYKVNDKTASVMGAENLAKPCIQLAVQSAAEKLGINPEYVLGGIKEIFEFNKQKRLKAKQINGEFFNEEEMVDAQASLKASDLLGKHLKLFVDKIELDAKVEVSSEDERKKLAKKVALMLFENSQD
jgi:phage terminase small subunit